MNKSQKEFYLREQLKAIKEELGDEDGQDIDKMRLRLAELDITPETFTEINRQINRLEKTSPDSMEAAVTRTYIDWMLTLPWNKYTEDNLDIEHAKTVLDREHYGLKEIKERILDFISIKKLKEDGHSPIICFVGPPGTGKTSLGKSIANSLGREYIRISLGGVKDEAEIRGHRRTYIGALPGKIIQAMKKAKTINPVILLDEIDKMSRDLHGDPASALLEVLDPEQNKTFVDHFLDMEYDLSKVMFITTANMLDTIPQALRDRLEIITFAGYTEDEKFQIAKNYIVKKQIIYI